MPGDYDSLDPLENTAAVVGLAESDHGWCQAFCLGSVQSASPVGENLYVLESLARYGDTQRIAAGFALNSYLPADPPESWVEEQYGLDYHLAEIDQIVVSSNVGQFVGKNGFEVIEQCGIEGSSFIEDQSERILTTAKKIRD